LGTIVSVLLAVIAGLAVAVPSTAAGDGPFGFVSARSEAMQHVWLHYDYMVAADGRSDAPDAAAVQMVVDAYAAHGIVLHVDGHHAEIPEHRYLLGILDCNPEPADSVNFYDLKAQYFHPTADHEWHYAIFGDAVDCRGSTGAAWIFGDDFALGLGQFAYIQSLPRDVRLRMEAGTIMHELGHNLGLDHGGGDSITTPGQ
jgi:hypothetical protein